MPVPEFCELGAVAALGVVVVWARAAGPDRVSAIATVQTIDFMAVPRISVLVKRAGCGFFRDNVEQCRTFLMRLNSH
jgi:hypothetical protein